MSTPCPLCGSNDNSIWVVGRPVRREWQGEPDSNLRECQKCTHGFVSPLPTDEVLDRCYGVNYAPYRPKHGEEDALNREIDQARSSGIFRHVQIKPGMHVLDVGCGAGGFLFGCRALEVEPSEHGVKSCKDIDVPVFHGMLDDFLEHSEAQFDLVTANHVVEHHKDPVLFLKQLAQCVKPGGTLWTSVPNWGCFAARQMKDQWDNSDLPVHLQHFTTTP